MGVDATGCSAGGIETIKLILKKKHWKKWGVQMEGDETEHKEAS